MEKTEKKIDEIAKLAEDLDLHLQKKVSDKDKKKTILNRLNGLLGGRGEGNIVLAQTNPRPGDIEYNALKAMEYIYAAEAIGADTIIFPELTLMGYQILDTIDRHPVIVKENLKWLKAIAKRTEKTNVIIGFVEPRFSEKVGRKYYNSVAVLGNGKVKGVIRKSLLPTYSEFYDYRYLEPSPVVGMQSGKTLGCFSPEKIEDTDKLAEINGLKYGIVICEDGWNDEEFFSNPLYSKDPVKELSEEYPDIMVNCSASPTRSKKEQLKHNMLTFVSKKYKTPFAYVNQVGANDDCSFDGSSRVYNKRGTLIARAKSFEEQFLIVNPLKSEGHIYPLTRGLDKTLKSQKVFSLDYEPDLERTYKTIIQGIKDYFGKNGLTRAVIGLSGGLDSTVSCTLLADALGAENVYGVSMPSKITSNESKSDAAKLAKNLGINFTEVPIKSMVDTMNETILPVFDTVERNWDNRYQKSFVSDNVQARSRAIILWGISNEFGSTIPIATSDKSELYMGYATINGDMSGGFAPIADVPKTKLFALARWMNRNRKVKNAIPEAIILKPPGAELAINPKTGKPLIAEDALMPYEFMDEVIWRIENKHESYLDMIDSRFLYESKTKVSKRQKTEWLDKFYKRMSRALYKWSILPPSVIVESRSINKTDYKQPITSCRIDYKGHTDKEIFDKLQEL
jgi:NAD+ synthetase